MKEIFAGNSFALYASRNVKTSHVTKEYRKGHIIPIGQRVVPLLSAGNLLLYDVNIMIITFQITLWKNIKNSQFLRVRQVAQRLL